MRRGRPLSELTLTTGERRTLERWVRRGKTAQSLAQRARIVLACSEGKTNTTVAGEVGVTRLTVGKWRWLHPTLLSTRRLHRHHDIRLQVCSERIRAKLGYRRKNSPSWRSL